MEVLDQLLNYVGSAKRHDMPRTIDVRVFRRCSDPQQMPMWLRKSSELSNAAGYEQIFEIGVVALSAILSVASCHSHLHVGYEAAFSVRYSNPRQSERDARKLLLTRFSERTSILLDYLFLIGSEHLARWRVHQMHLPTG